MVFKLEMEKRGKWDGYLHWGKYRKVGEWHSKRQNGMKIGNYINRANDRRLLPDGALTKTNRISEMYEKLSKYEKSLKYKIEIKWGQVISAVK